MARGKGIERQHQGAPEQETGLRGGANTLKLTMFVGALAVVVISFANWRQVSRMDERLSAQLRQVEARLAPATAPPAATTLEQPMPSQPAPDARSVNPTVSALVGVRPVGSRMPDPNRTYEFDLSTSPSKGPADAPISIVEFSDFQCSFCRNAQPTLARIQEVYGEQVRWVWKHLPLVMHEDAPMAHLASVAAARQGKFWEFQETLFANQDKLKPDDLRQHAFDIGLKLQQFEEDLSDPALQEVVEADMAEAVAIDLTATPGFFVNGRYIRGAMPFEAFAELINDELTKRGLPIPEAAKVEPESEVVE